MNPETPLVASSDDTRGVRCEWGRRHFFQMLKVNLSNTGINSQGTVEEWLRLGPALWECGPGSNRKMLRQMLTAIGRSEQLAGKGDL